MDSIQAVVHTERKFRCPCGSGYTFTIEHLMARPRADRPVEAGPWYCDDCYVGWWVEINAHGEVSLRDRGHRCRKTLETVELLPCPVKVVFKVKGMAFRDDGAVPTLADGGGGQYFYEEGTCPSNIMRSVQTVIYDGDDDPHGLFLYKGVEEWPDND